MNYDQLSKFRCPFINYWDACPPGHSTALDDILKYLKAVTEPWTQYGARKPNDLPPAKGDIFL